MQVEPLANFGVLKCKLPEKLKESLLKESETAKTENKELITGLTDRGVAEHRYVEKSMPELIPFIFSVKEQYDKTFPNLGNIGILTEACDYVMTTPWFNFQKKGEFLPQHTHDGVYSYNIWLKIPYNIEDEYSKNPKHSGNTISSFQFTYLSVDGKFKFHNIQLTKEDEGTIVMFTAKLPHLVYPFYSTDKTRVSIAGNILFDTRKK